MGSLKRCIGKVGLNEHEAGIIKAKVNAYRRRGFSAQESSIKAVGDYVAELEAERADVVAQLGPAAAQETQPPAPETSTPAAEAIAEATPPVPDAQEKPTAQPPAAEAQQAELFAPMVEAAKAMTEAAKALTETVKSTQEASNAKQDTKTGAPDEDVRQQQGPEERQGEMPAAEGRRGVREGGQGEEAVAAEPGDVIGSSPVDQAAHEAATSTKNELPQPTEAQKDAGNYRKGHITISGLDIAIENPEGSKRRPEWPTLKSHYGYLNGTVGKDKDHLDVFVKPGTTEDYSGPVFVVDQVNKDGTFDEHKILMGWPDEAAARAGYLENYTKGWSGLGAIKQFTMPELKLWLKAGNTKKPVALGQAQPKPSKKEPFTFAIKPQGDGFIIESDNGGGFVATRETGGRPLFAGGAKARVFKTQKEAELYAKSKKMTLVAEKTAAKSEAATGKINDVGEKAIEAAHAIGEANPSGDVADLRSQVLKDHESADIDDVTEAIHEGQYQGIRKIGEAMPVKVLESDISRDLANRAFNGTSHTPEKRAKVAIRDYVRTMVAAWSNAEEKSKTPEDRLRLTEQFRVFKDGYVSRLNAYLSAHGRVMSAFIVGPAKFPTSSNAKKSNAADNRLAELTEWERKGIKRLNDAAKGPTDKTPAGELDVARRKLQERQKLQDAMKAANNVVRDKALSNDQKVEKIIGLGLSEKLAREALKPDFMDRTGFPDYALKNNNAEIRRLTQRVDELKGKQQKAEEVGGSQDVAFDGGTVELDYANGVLRIRHSAKPPVEVRDQLKLEGFHWSPTNTAWQRKITDNAIAAAERITGAKLKTKVNVVKELFGGDVERFRNIVDDVRKNGIGEQAAPAKTEERAEMPPASRIEDFGETIEGARKHYAEDYKNRMRDALGVDIASEPLSKSWPEPDYQKLLDGGADQWAVAFVHSARDEIPPKPRQSWKVTGWVENVKTLRGFSQSILDGSITKERVNEELNKKEFARLRDALNGRIDLYQAIGHEHSLKGIRISAAEYSILGGQKIDPPRVIWAVEKKAGATSFSNWPTMMAHGDTREEAIANFKKAVADGVLDKKSSDRDVSFDIYSYRSGSKAGKYYIGKKIGKNYVDLESFDDAKAARSYLAENKEKLVEKLEKVKYIPDERRASNAPRVGVDHRNGANVTPEQFSETFGFRGVQFGNYVEGAKRQADLNEAYDALMDMAGVLGIPPKALSLNGELGLAFGARGKGAAGVGRNAKPPKAHYEYDHVVINLTKEKGAGSLAHEWWHALDNYFSRMRGDKTEYLTEKAYPRGEGVRPEIVAAFKKVIQTINETGLKERSNRLDKTRTKPYWETGREMSARAFESYIVEKLRDQGTSNDYLANIVSEDYWRAAAALGMEKEGTYPYPEAAEIPAVRAVYDNFFRTVETKETDKGTALFSRAGDQTKTPEFRKWFGDSKVVDENGEPLVVYHGTDQNITSFDYGKRGFNTGAKSAEGGFFFTNNARAAALYPVYDKELLFQFGKMVLKRPPRYFEATKEYKEWKAKPENKYGGIFSQELMNTDEYKRYEKELRLAKEEAENNNIISIGEKARKELQKILESASSLGISDKEYLSFEDALKGMKPFSSENTSLMGLYKKAQPHLISVRDAFDWKNNYQFSKQAWEGGDESGETWEAKKEDVSPNIMPVYLSMRNPLIHEQTTVYRDVTYAELIDRAMSAGNDGVIIRNSKDPLPMDVYIAFRPEQIKSAIGNRGTFSSDDPNILLSRASAGTDLGISIDDLETTVARVTQGHNNLPPIVTLKRPDQAPAKLRQQIEEQGATDVEGAFYDGCIYLFADNLRSEERAEHVLMDHELGHYVLRGVYGKELDPILNHIYLSNPKVARQAAELRKAHNLGSNAEAVEEVLVEMPSEELPRLRGWDRLVSFLRDWLASHGFNRLAERLNAGLVRKHGEQGAADLFAAEIITKAREWARSGEQTEETKLYMGVTKLSDIAPAFYSQLARAIESAKQAKAQAKEKKWGARVGTTEITVTPDDRTKDDEQVRVHSVDITTAMRDSIMQGQPLFSRPRTDDGQTKPATEEAAKAERESLPKGLFAHYKERATKIVDRIETALHPLGSLPRRDEYLIDRYLSMGIIGEFERIVESLGKAFGKANDADKANIVSYFTTRDADPKTIRNELSRADAVNAKKLIESIGDAMVARGMVSKEVIDANRGAYLPQLYLKFLIDESDLKSLSSGKKPGPMNYLKKRRIQRSQDKNGDTILTWKESGKRLSEEEVLKLGPIKDPGFLAATAISAPVRDMAILDFIAKISENEDWVLPNSLIKFDDEHATPQFLKDEADRLRRQAEHYGHEDAVKAHELADRMDKAANDALGNLGADYERFKQIPNSRRYGRLRGLYVRKEIYDDLVGTYDMAPKDMNAARSLLGYGGVGTKLTRAFKTAKVPLNLPSQVRNLLSTGIALQLSGMPLLMVPVYWKRAINEIVDDGPHWKTVRKYGGRNATFATQELYRIRRDLLDLEKREGNLNAIGEMHRILAIIVDGATDVHQFVEYMNKTASFIHSTEKLGMDERQAALKMHEWTFDYSLVPSWVRYLRSVPYGVPFITWYYKMAPRLIEVALLHPQRLLPWVVIASTWPMLWAMLTGEDEDEYERLMKAAPTFLQESGGAMILPIQDDDGRWQAWNAGYILPWTMFHDVAKDLSKGEFDEAARSAGAFSGPLTNIAVAMSTGKDPFTQRQIVDQGDPFKRRAIAYANYAWDLAAPPIISSRGLASPIGLLDKEYGGKIVQAATGRTNKYGDPTATAGQTALYPFGISIYSLEPDHSMAQNVLRYQHEAETTKLALQRRLHNRGLSDEERQEIVNEYSEELQRRLEKIKEYTEGVR